MKTVAVTTKTIDLRTETRGSRGVWSWTSLKFCSLEGCIKWGVEKYLGGGLQLLTVSFEHVTSISKGDYSLLRLPASNANSRSK